MEPLTEALEGLGKPRFLMWQLRTSRRALVLGLGAGALNLFRPACAQDARRRIAIIMGIGQGDEGEERLRAFRDALESYGWRLGAQLILDVIWAGGDPDRVERVTEIAVSWRPDVIVATATPIAVALRRRSVTCPVVFVNLVDPVGAGLIKNFSSPGTNFTGLTNTEPALAEKWLELLKEVAPKTTHVGFLFHPAGSPFKAFHEALETGARSLNLAIFDLPVVDAGDIETVVSTCDNVSSVGMVVMTDVFTSTHHRLIVDAIKKHNLPCVFPYRFFVTDGGLLSYSADTKDLYARAAGYVERILRGADPAELPVQTPSKFELVVNLRAASRLGLQIPTGIAAHTDEFLE